MHLFFIHFSGINVIIFPFVKQVLIRLIGADEHMYTNYMDSMKWLEDMNLLEMIVDKFSSSVSARRVIFWSNYFCLLILHEFF